MGNGSVMAYDGSGLLMFDQVGSLMEAQLARWRAGGGPAGGRGRAGRVSARGGRGQIGSERERGTSVCCDTKRGMALQHF